MELPLRPVTETIEVTAQSEAVAPSYSPSSTTLQKQTFAVLPLPVQTNLPDVLVTAAPGMIRGHDDFV